jgi:hypothetical protein
MGSNTPTPTPTTFSGIVVGGDGGNGGQPDLRGFSTIKTNKSRRSGCPPFPLDCPETPTKLQVFPSPGFPRGSATGALCHLSSYAPLSPQLVGHTNDDFLGSPASVCRGMNPQ